MTALGVCPKCGGQYHAYEDGAGGTIGTCYNCGETVTTGRTPEPEEDHREPTSWFVSWRGEHETIVRLFKTLEEAKEQAAKVRAAGIRWVSIEGAD